MSETVVLAKDLSTALAAVWHAVAVDEYRPVLTTVCFEQGGDGLRLVATDNYRIALYDVRLLEGSTAEQFATRALLGRESIKLLRYMLRPLKGPVTMTRTKERLRFVWISGAIELRLFDGTFLDYAPPIAPGGTPKIAVNPLYLAEAGAAFAKAGCTVLGLEIAGPLKPFVLRAEGCPLVTVVMPVRTGKEYETAPKTGKKAAAPPEADELRCVGSNHVPGCEHFGQPAGGPA